MWRWWRLMAWSDFRLQIRAVNETTRMASLSGDPAGSNRENDARYYVENAPDALGSPGQWHLDRSSVAFEYSSQAPARIRTRWK